MDFFKPRGFLLSLLSLLFIVLALTVYEKVGGIAGTVYMFGIFFGWALMSFGIEKGYLKNSGASLSKYMIHAVGMTVTLVVIDYVFGIVFGI
ncbi:MAG TPA: hypothetical protein VJK53_00855 [Candidatus Paceibacterota bacterium]